jgi:predicted nuclease of predicted toxin-antitoxin system
MQHIWPRSARLILREAFGGCKPITAMGRVFQSLGLVALRWSNIGAINAPDSELMAWAATNGYVIFDARSRLQHDFSP